jgi:hypothetical protein
VIAPPAAPGVRLLGVPRKLLAKGIVRFRAVVLAPAGVSKVEFLVDGRVVAHRGDAPFSFSWQTPSRRARHVALAVRVTDRLGRTASSQTAQIRVAGRR